MPTWAYLQVSREARLLTAPPQRSSLLMAALYASNRMTGAYQIFPIMNWSAQLKWDLFPFLTSNYYRGTMDKTILNKANVVGIYNTQSVTLVNIYFPYCQLSVIGNYHVTDKTIVLQRKRPARRHVPFYCWKDSKQESWARYSPRVDALLLTEAEIWAWWANFIMQSMRLVDRKTAIVWKKRRTSGINLPTGVEWISCGRTWEVSLQNISLIETTVAIIYHHEKETDPWIRKKPMMYLSK